MVGAVLLDLAERHRLDQGEVVAPLPRTSAASRSISSSLRPLSATMLILTASPAASAAAIPPSTCDEIAAPGDVAEALRVEAVEADIHPPDAGGVEHVGEAGEPGAVGGQGQLVEPVADPLAEPRDQVADPAPHQRLAAGQPDSPHAAGDEEVGELDDLLELSSSARGRKSICSAMQ